MAEKSTRDGFIEKNIPLVHSLCRRFTGKGIEYDDLFSSGCVGLVKAADNFNEDLGLKFSTYAVPVILGEVRRLFRDGGSVKVSRSIKELYLKIAKQREILSKSLGREPTVSELAAALSVSEEQIAEAVSAARPALSLTGGEDTKRAESDLPQADTSEAVLTKVAVHEAIKNLDERERSIIYLRYYKYLTQNETAKELNMTQVQVSRFEKKILLKMRGIIGRVS